MNYRIFSIKLYYILDSAARSIFVLRLCVFFAVVSINIFRVEKNGAKHSCSISIDQKSVIGCTFKKSFFGKLQSVITIRLHGYQ